MVGTKASTGAVAHPRVERDSPHDGVSVADRLEARQPREGRVAGISGNAGCVDRSDRFGHDVSLISSWCRAGAPSNRGEAPTSSWVYSWRGSRMTWSGSPRSTIRP